MKLLIDGRSAVLNRTTGWERYTRALVKAAEGFNNVDVYLPEKVSKGSLLIDDFYTLPKKAKDYSYVYFPSYVPGVNFPLEKAIVTIHDLTWWKYPETMSRGAKYYYSKLAKKSVSKVAAVVTVSEAVAAELKEITERPVFIVPNVVSIDEVKSSSKLQKWSKPYFLAVGSIEPRKNLTRLIEAYKKSGVSADFDLLLVGRKAWGDLPEGVQWLENLSDEALRFYYENSSAVFAASIYEGFGLPVAEAVALGKPIFCSDIPCFQEAGQGRINGVFNPYDITSISNSFIEASKNSVINIQGINNFTEGNMQSALKKVLEAIELDV